MENVKVIKKNVYSKQDEQAELTRAIQDFLKRGGKIKKGSEVNVKSITYRAKASSKKSRGETRQKP